VAHGRYSEITRTRTPMMPNALTGMVILVFIINIQDNRYIVDNINMFIPKYKVFTYWFRLEYGSEVLHWNVC